MVAIPGGWLGVSNKALIKKDSFNSSWAHSYDGFTFSFLYFTSGGVGWQWGRDTKATVGLAFWHVLKWALVLSGSSAYLPWSPRITQFSELALGKPAVYDHWPLSSRELSVAEELLDNSSWVPGVSRVRATFQSGSSQRSTLSVWDEEPKAKSGEETLGKERWWSLRNTLGLSNMLLRSLPPM